jgi:hypothetical protein
LLLIATGSAQTPWLQSHRLGNEIRFLYANLVRRYDLTTRSWLPDITLPRTGATAFTGDDLGNAVAYGTSIYRYSPSWSGESAPSLSSNPVRTLFLDGSLIISVASTATSGTVTIYNRNSGGAISSRPQAPGFDETSIHVKGQRKLIGWQPAPIGFEHELASVSYTTTGAISGTTPLGQRSYTPFRLFLSPDERLIIAAWGTCYLANSGAIAGVISANSILSTSWIGNSPVFLRDNSLNALRPDLTHAGGVTIAFNASELALYLSDAFIFRPTAAAPSVETIPLSRINAPDPVIGPINPSGFRYDIDHSSVSTDNVIHLFNRQLQSIFRWSTSSRSYLKSIALQQDTVNVNANRVSNLLYLTRPSVNRAIGKIDLSQPDPTESPFISLTTPSIDVAVAGDSLLSFTSDHISIHSPNGTLLSSSPFSYGLSPRHHHWDPATRRLYTIPDTSLSEAPAFLPIADDGSVGTFTQINSALTAPPLLASPSGHRLITGRGSIFDTSSLNTVEPLGFNQIDGIWIGQDFASIRKYLDNTILQLSPAPSFAPSPLFRVLRGLPVRVLPLTQGLAVITTVDRIPVFHLLDSSLNILYSSPTPPAAPGTPFLTSRSTDSISLQWTDLSDSEDRFIIEFRPAGTGSPWSQALTSPANSTAATVQGLSPGTSYDLRIIAATESVPSSPSPAITTRTLASPDEPLGEPYNLAIEQILNTSITIGWSDLVSNESAFLIHRSSSPDGPVTTLSAPPNSTSFKDSGLTPGATYYYRIQAINGDRYGDLSNQISASTRLTMPPPFAPISLTASEITASSVRLKFIADGYTHDAVVIEQSTFPPSAWAAVVELRPNIWSTVISGLNPLTRYSFRARAYNNSGSSPTRSIDVLTSSIGGSSLAAAMRSDDIHYFAISTPPRIERYDLAARSWLAPIPLIGRPSALWVDDSGIYTGEDSSIIRYQLDGSARTVFAICSSPVSFLSAIRDRIAALVGFNRWFTFSKTPGLAIPEAETGYSPSGTDATTFDPARLRLIINPASRAIPGVQLLTFAPDGSLSSSTRHSPIIFPDEFQPLRFFFFPDGTRLADNLGNVYLTAPRTPIVTNMTPAFTDMAFHGSNIPIILRPGRLTAYSSGLTESGSTSLSSTHGVRLTLHSDDAVVFSLDPVSPRGLRAESIPLQSLNLNAPDLPVNPRNLAFTPDSSLATPDGVVWLLSRLHLSLFRWSRATRDFLPTIPLKNTPLFISHSTADSRVYLNYENGVTTFFDASATSPAEQPFASASPNATSMTAADPFVIIGSEIYNNAGTRLGQFTTRPIATSWNKDARRLHSLSRLDSFPPTDEITSLILTPSGQLQSATTVYSLNSTQNPLMPPLRQNPDGTTLVLGSGQVFTIGSLGLPAGSVTPFTDALWVANNLLSIHQATGNTRLQLSRTTALTPDPASRTFRGTPFRIFPSDSGFLLLTLAEGTPRFTLTDPNFNPLYQSPAKPPPPTQPVVSSRTPHSISLTWADTSDNSTGFQIEFRPATPDAQWTRLPIQPAGNTSATISNLNNNSLFEIRIVAIGDDLRSNPSAITTSKTLASDEEPIGEPYNLTAIRRFHNSITLSWSDNATNESGFRISRSLSPSGPSTSFVVDANTTSFTDSNVSPATTYLYRIQAFNDTTDGDLSSALSAQTLPAASTPPAPSNLAASDISHQQLSLSWSDNSFNEDSFILEFRPATGPVVPWATARTLPFNSTSTVITGLTPATSYSFRVVALNSSGSTAGTVITATTPAAGGTFLNISSRSSRFYCFAFAEPFRIERFDLNSLQWLSPLPMTAAATALCIDESGIFAAEARNIIRWNLDGTNRSVVTSTTSPVSRIFTSGNILGAFDGQLRTYLKSSGAPLSSITTPEGFSAPSLHPSTNRIFFRGPSASIPTLHAIDFSPDGTLVSRTSAPRPAAAYTATATWTFPDGTRVIDSAGNIHGARALAPVTSIPSPSGSTVVDVAFHGTDLPVILRSPGAVTGYHNSMLASGSRSTSRRNPSGLAVTGTNAIVFSADGTSFNGLGIDIIPLSALSLPTPGQPVNPDGLTFSPANAFIDKDGSLRLTAPSMMSLFTWSPSERKYSGSLPLSGPPLITSYQPATDRLYYSEGGSGIRMASLYNPPSPDQHFTTLPNPVGTLITADNFLCAAAFAPTTATHHIYNAAGQLTSSSGSTARADFLTWDPVSRQIAFLSTPTSLARVSISPAGLYTPELSRQLLNDATAPFRVSPDNSLIAFSNGHFIDNISNPQPRFFDGTPTDLVWQNRNLVALEPSGSSNTRVQRWSTSWLRDRAAILTGSPWRIFQIPSGGFIVITTAPNSPPRFHLLNQNLEPQFDSGTSSPLTVRSAPAPQRVDFGDPATFQVLVTGTPPFTYRWSLNGSLIPGATESHLTIPRAGSLSAGNYQVTVSDANGSAGPLTAPLAVGPVQTATYLERSLLVSGSSQVAQFTEPLFNSVRSSVLVPQHPVTVPASSTRILAGTASDRLGRLHVLSHSSRLSITSEFLNTYDPALTSWTQRMLPGPASSDRQSVGDLRMLGLWAVTQRGLLHTTTGEWRPFTTSWIPSRVAVGPDQLIYGMNQSGSIRVWNANSNSWNLVTSLPTTSTYSAFDISPDGNFHTIAQGTYRSFGVTGTPIRSLTPASALNARNLAIRPSGTSLLAAGTFNPTAVSLTQTDLVSESRVTISSSISTSGCYAGWVVPIDVTRPAIVSLSAPPALSGSPWSWQPEFTHPDPDAVLSITLSNHPSWISLSNGILSGTPLASNVGQNPVSIRVSDSRGNVDERFFSIPVFAKNDPPVIPAAIPDISASNSAADQLISFAPFASDPDAGDPLTWRITANSNPALFSSLSFNPQNRLSIRYAPYLSGTATISVSVTDRFGASAQRSFNVTVPPLPAPTITSQNTPSFNPLTGLWELPVTIQNIAQRAIGGFSVAVSSLPEGTSLYNASNAVSPSPSITDARPLNPNQSVSLTLEFLHPSQDPLPTPTLTTATTLPRPALPTPFAIDRASFLSPESLLLEFPSEPGVLYQIQYSSDGINWLDSLSRIRAAGTSTQWFDSGSPRTSSPPGAGSRFYRVKRLSAS